MDDKPISDMASEEPEECNMYIVIYLHDPKAHDSYYALPKCIDCDEELDEDPQELPDPVRCPDCHANSDNVLDDTEEIIDALTAQGRYP